MIPTLLLALAAGSSLILAGCGKTEAPAAAPAAVSADGVRAIELTANDAMKFSLTEIRAKPGEKLRVSFTNVGRLPKQSMGHNWVLLTPMDDAAVMSFAASAAAKTPEYLPEDKTAVLAHTRILGGGETQTIEFTVPSTPGTYPFLCTFPGHAALMKGKLIVAP